MSDTALNQIAVGLGADVPVCLLSKVSLVSGIGQIVEPEPALPEIHAVLVNPRVAVPTGPIFQALGLLQGTVASDPVPPPSRGAFRSAETLVEYLRGCRNDLESPAAAMVREIADVEEALFASDGCLMARMSGSGATCFGLFVHHTEADEAAARLTRDHPGWWVAAGGLN
jgi:4-diphosphocytidyl-2-C-methyl-D-erythritol kinase